MGEDYISEYWNPDRTRQASVSKDKHHYIVRMKARRGDQSDLQLYHTELIHDKSLAFVEDMAENFVFSIGAFADLNWDRTSS